MRVIPIEPVPNQELSVNIDGVRWVIRIKVAESTMVCDISHGDEAIILGARIAVGTPMIPYPYLSADGNFLFLVDNEEMPDWRKFGVSQQLVYVPAGGDNA